MKLFSSIIAASAVAIGSAFIAAPDARAFDMFDYAQSIIDDANRDADRIMDIGRSPAYQPMSLPRPQTCRVSPIYGDSYSVDCY